MAATEDTIYMVYSNMWDKNWLQHRTYWLVLLPHHSKSHHQPNTIIRYVKPLTNRLHLDYNIPRVAKKRWYRWNNIWSVCLQTEHAVKVINSYILFICVVIFNTWLCYMSGLTIYQHNLIVIKCVKHVLFWYFAVYWM